MMAHEKPFVHPYIPNSAPAMRAAMLGEIGVPSVDDLYAAIPEDLRLRRPLDLPAPHMSEFALRRHVEGLLAKNTSCTQALNFLGGGCWQHYVPAVCDEVISRAEFLTAYGGDTYADLGKYQAIFEYQSMIGELVGMDVVSSPTYDWLAAATSAVLMATRLTGRTTVLIPATIAPERHAHMRTAAQPWATLVPVRVDPATGLLDLDDLRAKMSPAVAAVYVENPSYLGIIESQGGEIADLAHGAGALSVVGVDASSLGVLAPPSAYGADIVCGETQPLGVHMHYGGGLCGFIATRDDPRYVMEYPSILVSIAPGGRDGERGYGWSTHDRTSYEKREASADFIGTTQWLFGIAGAVYLALMGPRGMHDLGEAIMMKSHYAMARLSEIPGVRTPVFTAPHFKEFVINFDDAGMPVRDINAALRSRGIFGGKDLTHDFPDLGHSALYCVTEIHTRDDIDRLGSALEEVLR